MGITQIDWSNAGFIRTYTMAFGASVFLTVVLWLVAVAKRAFQGVDPLRALGESIGYLLLSVMTSAFAPLGIAYMTQVFDGIADAMLAPVGWDLVKIGAVLGGMLAILCFIPGGAVIVIAVGFFLLMAILGVWLELIVRNALIYTGLVFGPTVFAGLVDRDLWGHSKRWFGILAGIIASKYVTFTTLALASALLAEQKSDKASIAQAFGTILTALALLFLALYLPFQVARFVPILGDQVQDVFNSRKQMEGGLSNAAQSARSSFGEIKSKLGGSSDDDSEAGFGDGAEGAAAAVGGEAAPGGGLARAAGDGGQEVEAAAMRGVDGATAATEQDDSQGDETAAVDGAAGSPDQTQGTDGQTQNVDEQAQPGSADVPQAEDPQQDPVAGAASPDDGPGAGPSESVGGGSLSGGTASGPARFGEDPAPLADAALSVSTAPAETFSDGSPVEEPPYDGE
ncbi:hypothetical protein [Kitasatospora sp. NPDC088779]|uniref:hypothetical protein n=1 Tax=unclassified Kitasatospora TaxID=2633591 RepID=UPI00341577AA